MNASKKGISAHQLHRMLDITYKSAWFMAHRIRYAMTQEHLGKLLGTGEAEETYIGGKEKNKHQNKRTKGAQGRSTKTKVPGAVLVESGGKLHPGGGATDKQPLVALPNLQVVPKRFWGADRRGQFSRPAPIGG